MNILFIKTQDLADVIEVSLRTAKKRLAKVREEYGIPKYKNVSIEKYSQCYGLQQEQVIRAVQEVRQNRKKHKSF